MKLTLEEFGLALFGAAFLTALLGASGLFECAKFAQQLPQF